MPDPLSVTAAIALAGKCINGVTKVVNSGREIESAMGHISRWFECVSDVNAAERRAKNPILKAVMHEYLQAVVNLLKFIVSLKVVMYLM